MTDLHSSRRLDATLTGHSPTSADSAVVAELKRRSDASIGQSTTKNQVIGSKAGKLVRASQRGSNGNT